MPFLADSAEPWHALVAPSAHKGEGNPLNRSEPGTLFEVSKPDSDEVCMVITTAGFLTGQGFRIERVIDFRRKVDATKEAKRRGPVREHICAIASVAIIR